jgi:hypothetical protein
MEQRRGIGFVTLIIIGIALGYILKGVKVGLVIGLGIGLLASSLLRRRR